MIELVEYFRLFCFLFACWLLSLSGNMLKALFWLFLEYTQLLKSQLSFMSKN